MALEIVRSNTDGVTGHISVHVRAIEESPSGEVTHGPIEVVGIDHHSLMNIYHGPSEPTPGTMRTAILKWLASHHSTALYRKRAISQSSGVVDALKGHVINFEGEK